MSKSANKLQLKNLIALMEANPDIARGFYKGNKEEVARFWQRAEVDLNSMGPPSKCIAEWKKVWADQKKYVRQKAAQNLINRNGTGGGPNREQKLSSGEEAIYNLVGMKASIEGVSTKNFGLCTDHLETPPIPTVLEDLVPCAAEVSEERPTSVACADVAQKSVTVLSSKPSKTVKGGSDALQAELNIQRELLDTVKEAVAQSEQHHKDSKRLFRCVEKTYDLRKSHYKQMEIMKREEIEEMRRHNAYMEKMRATELQYKLEKNNIQLELLAQQE